MDRHPMGKFVEHTRSPAQTSGRGTPRFKRPAQLIPAPSKLTYGEPFLITTVDGQHCLCPNMFNSNLFLIPIRYAKDSGILPMCCFIFQNLSSDGKGFQDFKSSGDAASSFVCAGDDMNIRHRISGRYIRFDDLQSPIQEPAQSCANMTDAVSSQSRLRLQYRVSLDAEVRFMLSRSELSICAHANVESFLCPVEQCSGDYCTEVIFSDRRHSGWVIEATSAAVVEGMVPSRAHPHGIRCGSLGRIKNTQGLTLSYHPLALFPVFIPSDSVTSDGSWTDPDSVWTIWTFQDAENCFNMSHGSSHVYLQHVITARFIQMGEPCKPVSSVSSNQDMSINAIGVAENRGMKLSLSHIDQHRFMLSCNDSGVHSLVIQSSSMHPEVLASLASNDPLFSSATPPISLATAAPGCSSLHLLTACPFRSESSILLWKPESDHIQHLIYSISPLVISSAHARAELLSEMGAAILAAKPAPEPTEAHAAGTSHDIESRLMDGMAAVKSMGAFFSENMTSLNDKMKSVGASAVNQVSTLGDSQSGSPSKTAHIRPAANVEMECLNQLCYLASSVLDPLTDVVRTTCAIIQSEGMPAVQVLQSLEVLSVFGEIAFLFSLYLVHSLSSIRTGQQVHPGLDKPLRNKCLFVGCIADGPISSFYQHIVAFRGCIKSQYFGPSATQVLGELLGDSVDGWRGLDSLIYLSPSFRNFITSVGEIVKLCGQALPSFHCNSSLFKCILTAVPYYIRCERTLMSLLNLEHVRSQYGQSIVEVAFQRLVLFFKGCAFFSESHLQRQAKSKEGAHQEFWVSEGSYWINVISFLAEQPLLEGMAFRRQIYSRLLEAVSQGGALPVFKAVNGGSSLLVARPSVAQDNAGDLPKNQPQNATARWVTSGGLRSVGRGSELEPGWTDLMSCDVQKATTLTMSGNLIPPHEIVTLVSSTLTLYHNLVFHEVHKKFIPHLWPDTLQFVCRQCPSEFVLGCLSNPLFSHDIRRAACRLTIRLAFQSARRQFSLPILSWSSEMVIPIHDVESNRTTFTQWINNYDLLKPILLNLLEYFKPEEEYRRPPPFITIAFIELACEAVANNLWSDLPSIKHLYTTFSGIFLQALTPDQDRERSLRLNAIQRNLPFLQKHYIKNIRDGFKFVVAGPGDVVCSGHQQETDPCIVICQQGELSLCFDDQGNGPVCIKTVSSDEILGLECLDYVATNWFNESALSAAPLRLPKCIATRQSKLWIITRSALLSAVLTRSNQADQSGLMSNVEIDLRCLASFAMSLCLEQERKAFCLQAVQQIRLHINLAPGIYLRPTRPFKQQRATESLSLVLGDVSASVVEHLFRASGGHLLRNSTKVMGFPINRAAGFVFILHMIISSGLTALSVLNRLGRVDNISMGQDQNASHEFLSVMFILWFLFSGYGLHSVSKRRPRHIQWALILHCVVVVICVIGLIASSYGELEVLPYAAVLSKLAAGLLTIFFEGYLILIVLTYFALLSKKEAMRTSIAESELHQEPTDNLLIDHFSKNQLFASSSAIIFSQIASSESRLSETASHFFVSNCQNKAKLSTALESCVLLRTPHSEMVVQALVVASKDVLKHALELIEIVLASSHPLSIQHKHRVWPPVLKDTGVLSQSGKLVSLLVNLKIKVGVIHDTLRKEAEKYDEQSGGMSPTEWRRVAYASQLDTSLCIIVGVARTICSFSSSFEVLRCPSEKGNQLVALCLELMAWCCVEDVFWQEIVAALLCEVGPTIVFISPCHAAAAVAESCRNNIRMRTSHGKTLVSVLCSAFESNNVRLFQKPQLEAILRALRVLVAGSVVTATIPVEGLGEIVIEHVLLFATQILEDLASVKCRFIATDDSDVRDRFDMNTDSVSDRQLVPCGRCEGSGMQKGFKCCFCDGRRYVSVSLAQAPSVSLFDEHELSIAPRVADSTSKVQAFGIRSVSSSAWWIRSGENCCIETLYLLAVTCEIGNHFLSSQIREIISFDCASKAACDATASQELRAALVRFCASVHIPAAIANHSDRRWSNPVHPAWLITDALSRFVQDSPVSRLDDVAHGSSSPAFVLLTIWTPVIESLCKRVLALSARPIPRPVKELLRRYGDSICISGCSSTNVTVCQNALSCLSVLRALDLKPQSALFESFDIYITHEIFARNALDSLKATNLSASTSDISAMRWKSYITAIKPPVEHIELAIANHLIKAEPGIHVSTSVSSTIAFNLCSSCRKGGFFFDQHDTWNDVVRGITQAIEASTARLHIDNIAPIKWLSEGVCNIIIDAISMSAVPSIHRFAHSSGGLYLGIRFLHSFKHHGQEMLLSAVLKRPDDNFFAGLIAIIDEASVAAPRVASIFNQVVQSLKKEKQSREAAVSQGAKVGDSFGQFIHQPGAIEESKLWERLDQYVYKSSDCTLSQRLAFGGLVAKFVQCWCEDHNASVQDAFAGLRPNGSSNPIISLVNLVLVCSRQACAPLQMITSLALEAITESIQGPCKQQQVAVAQTDLVHACDDLILGRWSDGTDAMISYSCNCPLPVPETLRTVMQAHYSFSAIRSKACGVLLALIESLEQESSSEVTIPLLILKAMRIEEHRKALSQLDHTNEEDRNTCVSIVVVLLTLHPFMPKFGLWASKAACIKSILHPDTRDDIPIMAHVRQRIRCVDVMRKGSLNRVWFPQPDLMDCTRSYYLETVQRSIFNPGDRDAQCVAFILLSLALIEQMLLDQSLTRHRASRILKSAVSWVQYLFNLNAIIINAIMLFAFEHRDEAQSSSIDSTLFINLSTEINFRNSQYMYTLRALSAIQLCFSIFMFCWFMATDVSFIVRERIRQNPVWMKVFVNKRGGPEHFVIWCRSVGSNSRFVTLLAYLIVSILAISLPDRLTPMLFLSLHLADVIYISKDMKVVLDFISSVWRSLVTIIGFIFILLNIFGAVGFVWIPDWFELPEPNADWYPAVNGSIASGDAVESTCSTLWRCFLVQVDKGLVLGDIDYGVISTSSDTLPEMMYSRMFYSFVFQVVVGILFSFILYTVVIDSFSKFRMKNDELDYQINNKCLICGLGRDELGSLDSFESHITSVHGLFDYIAFIAMIILKDRSTLTGPESAVFNCIVDVTPSGVQPKAKPDTSWLPFRRVSSQFSFSSHPATATPSSSSAAKPEEALQAAVLLTQEWIKKITAKTSG